MGEEKKPATLLGRGGQAKEKSLQASNELRLVRGRTLPPAPREEGLVPTSLSWAEAQASGGSGGTDSGKDGSRPRGPLGLSPPAQGPHVLRDPFPLGAAAAPQHVLRSPCSPFAGVPSQPLCPPHGGPCLPLEPQASFCLSARASSSEIRGCEPKARDAHRANRFTILT